MKLTVALSAKPFCSVSAAKSLLQKEYSKTLADLCAKYEVQHPFELKDEALKEFFSEVSSTWKTRKRELYQAGQITADQL